MNYAEQIEWFCSFYATGNSYYFVVIVMGGGGGRGGLLKGTFIKEGRLIQG